MSALQCKVEAPNARNCAQQTYKKLFVCRKTAPQKDVRVLVGSVLLNTHLDVEMVHAAEASETEPVSGDN